MEIKSHTDKNHSNTLEQITGRKNIPAGFQREKKEKRNAIPSQWLLC